MPQANAWDFDIFFKYMELIPGGRDNASIPWLPFRRYGAQYVSQKLNKAPTPWRDFVTWTFSEKNKTIDKIKNIFNKTIVIQYHYTSSRFTTIL